MESTVKLIRKKRKFSESFKRSIVDAFESGKYSVLQLERLHNIGNRLIYSWIYQYSTINEQGYRIIEMKESSTARIKELEKQLKELQAIIGKKQIHIDYLDKLIEVAEEDLSIEIKKKSSTPQSLGSGRTQTR